MGQRSIGCLQLRFKDVCKRDMRTLDINTESWEDLAADSGSWKNTLHKQLMLGKEKLIVVEDEQRAHRKDPTTRPETTHRCNLCNRDFPSVRLACLITDNTAQADSLDRSTHGWPWPTWAYYCYYLKFMACCTYLNSVTMVNININIQNTWMIPVQNEKPILLM